MCSLELRIFIRCEGPIPFLILSQNVNCLRKRVFLVQDRYTPKRSYG